MPENYVQFKPPFNSFISMPFKKSLFRNNSNHNLVMFDFKFANPGYFMRLLIISSSLSAYSRSRSMAGYCKEQLDDMDTETELIDLIDYPLPLCDGSRKTIDDPMTVQVKEKIHKAEGILIATPIYNFNINAALKNLIELTGRAWTDKVVGFICSAGGGRSYMSVMGLANSLMLDFRCIIIPRFVYFNESSGNKNLELDDTTKHRLDKLNKELIRFVKGLKRN
jgi:NAD(P)H-dependent FMN reductase